MTQALAITPEQLRDVQQDVNDNTLPDAFLDAVELMEAFITRGWGTATAKSEEYGKVDQSMLQHAGNAITALVRLYTLTDAFSEEKLRVMIALMLAHDFHKQRADDGTAAQFDITYDEVTTFITETGLADYVGGAVDPELFQAAMVMLHRNDSRARVEEAPASFDEYRPYLNFADAVASTPHPSDFTDLSKTHSLREALGPNYTINHHEITNAHGLTANLIHQSVADALEPRGYDLFTIYNEGCTYLGRDRCAEIPIPTDEDDNLIDDICAAFFDNIRTAHTAFQNPDNMDGAVPLTRYRYYEITDRDFVFATPEDIVRAIVQRSVGDAQSSTDIPDAVHDGIDTIEARLDSAHALSIDRNRRVDGLARLIHTVRVHIAPDLAPTTDPLEVVCDLFNVSPDTYEAAADLVAADAHQRDQPKQWPVKYVLAQDVVTKYFDGSRPDEIIAALGDDLITACEQYSRWESLGDRRAQDIRDELTAFILYNVKLDGRRLIRETSGREEYDRFDAVAHHQCSLCKQYTSVAPEDGARLLKSYPDKLSLTHANGEDRTLRQTIPTKDYTYCAPCQLDLALRLTRDDGGDPDADRLYAHIIPDYFFSPMLWTTYRRIFNTYLSINTTDTVELAKSIFHSDVADGYRSWLRTTLESDAVADLFHDQDSAFGPETGFGTHAISRQKPTGITETEELFIALAAAAYAGVRVYVTNSPITRIQSDDFDTAIKLSDDFDITRYTGTEISLTDLSDVLSIIAAMLRLADARERDCDPLDALDMLTSSTPLPGAMLLGQLADEYPGRAPQYIDEARYLDEQVVQAALAADTPTDAGETDGWPLAMSVSTTPANPATIHHATAALAGTAWPFMNPDAITQETLCAPFDAACKAIETVRDELGDEVTDAELRSRIERAVADALGFYYPGQGRRYKGRVAAFADTLVTDVINDLCDGRLASVSALQSTLRDSFYAAMLELATQSFELEVDR